MGSKKGGVLPQQELVSIKSVGAAATRKRQYKQRGAAATRNGQYKKRSEEHTSELQSRETISYAVFCLKKKKKQKTVTKNQTEAGVTEINNG